VGLVAAAVLAVVHWRHGRTLKYVGWAIPGIAVVTAVIVLTGSARNYYLPSIVIASVNAVLLVGSAVVRRPALGYVAARMDRTRFAGWREDRRLLHVLCGLTLVWGVVIGARALVQWWLYFAENDGWLAAFRLSSTPVTLGLGFVTFVLIRRARPAPVPEPA
jgi:intracellular septation protein A